MYNNSHHIENLLKKVTSIKDQYQISLLTNTANKTKAIQQKTLHDSDYHEFLSVKEYVEILKGIEQAGFHTHTYFNELEFIHQTLEEAYYQHRQIVYNLAHNGNFVGKKSLIPSFCDLLSIPYIGSNAWVSSFCKARYMYSKYAIAHGIKTPKSWVYSSDDTWFNNDSPMHGQKIIVKPLYEFALTNWGEKPIFKYDAKTFKDGLHQTKLKEQYPRSTQWLVQEYISGYDCEVPLFIDQKPIDLAIVGVFIHRVTAVKTNLLMSEGLYHYDFYDIHSILKKEQIDCISVTARTIAQLIGLRHYGKINFRIDNQGDIYLLDIDSSPQTTKHSSFDYTFKQLGFKNSDIYACIIAMACEQMVTC
ncbi:hypothetical protein [Paenibacillus campi]|uniref:hypothetical protein n=1 Tax=Paenibacillus campi TaxID=3106031 RepID=UPI002AFEF9E0|nr:hypothetical protein [Paenibacillus sp. SGZ-1009]